MDVRLRRLVVLASAVVFVPALAFAQHSSPAGRVVFGGFGGVTVTGAATDSAAAAQFGVRVLPRLVVFGEGGRLQNVLPPHREIGMEQAISHLILRDTSATVAVDAAYPANYGLGGVRWLVRSFFLEGGIGSASFRTLVNHVTSNGSDITALATSGSDHGAQFVSLFALGAGVNRHIAGPLSVDLGYRYTHINTFAPSSNPHMLYFGVKFAQGK